MQNAVRDRLVDFFRDNAEVGNPEFTIKIEDIKSFLKTISDISGNRLLDITIDSPASDLVATAGQIYTRGNVNFV